LQPFPRQQGHVVVGSNSGYYSQVYLKLFRNSLTVEQELVQGCIAGKRAMQKQLYELYSKKMMAVCLRYARTSFEAEDILQEAFIKVFEYIKNFKGECPLEFWIRRIMVNTALKHHRKKMYVSSVAETDKVENIPEEEFIISGYAYEDLLSMIQSLAPRYQLIFNLYAIEGYSHKEIATMLEISEGTSKSQYSRARAILKNMLERHEEKYNERIIR
jgi:RNA polymerase sigma-70 factor (ECF subfamily)